MKPLVSVLLPTCARFLTGMLESAVQSVLKQDYTPFELLVVDDGSVDGSKEYLKALAAKDSRVRHIRFDKNVGLPALTLAKAFLESKGEYLSFNFDDTVLRKDCLSSAVAKMQSNPELGMVYGQMIMHMPDGDIIYGKEPDLNELTQFNFIGNASVMLRRSVIAKVGWYDPHILLKRSCDWDLWLRIFKSVPVGFIPKVLSEEYGQNLTDSFRRSHYLFDDLRELYMSTERNDTLSPKALVGGQHSTTKTNLSLTPEQKRQLSIASLEHFVRVLDLDNVAKTAAELLADGHQDVKMLWQRVTNSTTDKREQLILLGTTYYYSNKLEIAQTALHQHEAELHDVSQELGAYKDKYHALLRSLSWRVTKPLRETMVLLSGRNKESNDVR